MATGVRAAATVLVVGAEEAEEVVVVVALAVAEAVGGEEDQAQMATRPSSCSIHFMIGRQWEDNSLSKKQLHAGQISPRTSKRRSLHMPCT